MKLYASLLSSIKNSNSYCLKIFRLLHVSWKDKNNNKRCRTNVEAFPVLNIELCDYFNRRPRRKSKYIMLVPQTLQDKARYDSQ